MQRPRNLPPPTSLHTSCGFMHACYISCPSLPLETFIQKLTEFQVISIHSCNSALHFTRWISYEHCQCSTDRFCNSLENFNGLRRYRFEFRHCSSTKKHNTQVDTITLYSQPREFFVQLFFYKKISSTPKGRTMFISLYATPHNEHVEGRTTRLLMCLK